eukprot:3242844-Heterocapsa_arctica.AAC.1
MKSSSLRTSGCRNSGTASTRWATAWLCAQGLAAFGLLEKPVSPDELQKSFFEEVRRRRAGAQSPAGILPRSTLFAEPVAMDAHLMGGL